VTDSPHVARRPRWPAAVLGAAGLMILAASLLMLYVGRTLARDASFAQRVSDSLDDPHVAEFVALRITDVLIEQEPDLTALRPILVVVTRGVVASAPFRALVRPAVRQAHQALMSSTTEHILLAVPDARVLIHEALATVGPAAADRLPPRLRPVLDAGVGAPWLPVVRGLFAAAGRLRPFGLLGLAVAGLCLVVAVVVAPNRRVTLLAIGVGVATTGVLLGMTVPAGRVLAMAAIPEAGTAAAAAGLWRAFLGPLRVAGLCVALIGVALALMAIPGDGVDGRALRSRMWGFVSQRRQRPLEEVARLAGIGAAGLLAALEPTFALSLAAVVGGAVLLLLSLVGVRQLIQPHLPMALRGTPEGINVARPVLVGVRVTVLLGLGVAAAAGLLRLRPPVEAIAATGGTCNGAATLCARPFNEVVFPGAHNAMGAATNPDWLFPNQDLDLRRLLDRGVRAFLLDPYRGNRIGDRVKTDFDAVPHANRKIAEVIGDEAWAAGMRIRERLIGAPGASAVYLCHGFCELGAIPLVPTLRSFVQFLVLHPGEVIILDFEDYVPPSDIARAFDESGLIDFVYRGPLGPAWPTLGDMVASGGRVVVLGETDVGDVPWYHLTWDGLLAETPYTFHAPEEFSCRANRGTPRAPLFLVNHWIETTPTPRPSNAQVVNQRDVIVQRARRCARERGMTPNIIAVDFAGIGDVVGAARELNGLPAVDRIAAASP